MSTQPFTLDLQGRVEKLKLGRSKGMNAVFEAIYNAIQAIQEREIEDGLVEIKIFRERIVENLGLEGDNSLPKIIGFEIIDNGIGFNNANFKSFLTSDSRYKLKRGGKGVGRFLWLKVFKDIEVKSKYLDNEKQMVREFTFNLADDLIDQVVESQDENFETKVVLRNIFSEYEDGFSKRTETIAWQIIEHIILDFVNKKVPKLVLIDLDTTLILNEMFEKEISGTLTENEIVVQDKRFNQKTFRIRHSPSECHSIFLYAQGRGVHTEKLEKYIKQLRGKVTFNDDDFFVLSCISGEYLDKSVNEERTSFTFSKDSELDIFNQDMLIEEAVKEVRNYTKDYIEKIQKDTSIKVKDYIEQKAPEYRFLLQDKYKDIIEDIDPDIQDKPLDTKLHAIKFEISIELRKNMRELVELPANSPEEIDEYRERLSKYIENENEIGKADLIKYVIHRKIIIDLLEKSLEIQMDGRYPLEEEIHKIIHPLRTTSNDVDFFDQNLWIIDERLAYHRFLASDKTFKSLPILDSKSTKETDIIAYFDNPIAFADSKTDFQSLVIVEFKRSSRNNYSSDDNPMMQVAEYVQIIRGGSAKDYNGRPISNKEIPIFCYIICDITPKLVAQLAAIGYTEMFDGQGYFFYNPKLTFYAEVISYNKMVSDAKKRNRIFFEMLKIPIS